MFKKGQAAMEFLMTYGWAILVVLAAIGALAYFGVLSPEKMVPERTTFTAPFPSSESAVVTGNTVQVALTNNFGQKVEILNTNASASAVGDCTGPVNVSVVRIGSTANPTNLNVSNGETFILEWVCGDFNGKTSGDRFDTDLTFQYRTPSGLEHPHTGSVNGKVQ